MIWILCLFSLFLTSCEQKPQETHYKEVIVEAPQVSVPSAPAAAALPAQDPHAGLDMPAVGSAMGMNSPGNSDMFTWVAPKGWKEEPGEGMRLATFHLLSDTKAIDCSIVSLGGMAGGLEANLRRWMGQIGVKATDDQLSKLIASAPGTKIKTGQEGKIFDFTSIQTRARSSDKSMIVVMVVMDEATLFVKMTGTVGSVNRNKEGFFKLAGSVEFHGQSGAPAPAMNAADPHAGLDMSSMGALISQPTSQNLLVWTSPEGWKEEPGTHMRMATFHALADPKAIDCSIIALVGPAGGPEANLTRWMGQIGLQPSDDHLKQLIVSAQDIKTKDGLDARVFDFTGLQAQADPSETSMVAAMISVDQTTVFVKMTGSIASVKQNRDNYLKLLGSIARK